MQYKKLLVDIVIISIAFVIFASWYNAFQKKDVAASKSFQQFYKIYLITVNKESEYWKEVDRGASDMARSLGVTYIWDAPEQTNLSKQIEIINHAVDQGANALLVAADDPKRISSVIEDAKARGVKIIYVDSPAYEEAITTLATDNIEAGNIAGNLMLEELRKSGFGSGSIGIINIQDKANTLLREQGFRKTIEEDGRFVLLNTVYINGEAIEAQAAAETMIHENNDLVGIFATNLHTTEGVGNAIKADQHNIVGIGFDKSDTTLQLLKEGSLKAIILQNPYTMGYLGVAEAIAALEGNDTGPAYLNTGVSVLRNE